MFRKFVETSVIISLEKDNSPYFEKKFQKLFKLEKNPPSISKSGGILGLKKKKRKKKKKQKKKGKEKKKKKKKKKRKEKKEKNKKEKRKKQHIEKSKKKKGNVICSSFFLSFFDFFSKLATLKNLSRVKAKARRRFFTAVIFLNFSVERLVVKFCGIR